MIGPSAECDDLELAVEENHWVLPQRVHPTISRIAESLGIPKEVERTANKLLMWYKLVKKRKVTPSLSLASIILASRAHGVAVPLGSVEGLDRASPRAVMRALRELKSVVGEEKFWDSYLNYIITNLIPTLNLGENQHLVRERLWVRAKKELVRILRESGVEVMGKNPLGIVALATYLAAKRCGLRVVSLEVVARCSGVHRNTLYRISRRLGNGR
ncbi:MAG: hypothetical protein NZ992_05185 [Candidatus Korarchaeum sp.]|nr:hypothetical protein [Candidatus Korarchaeum sp.]MDW8035731.1 hypothetical protein [Candidatus Korarchaeum sp.]